MPHRCAAFSRVLYIKNVSDPDVNVYEMVNIVLKSAKKQHSYK